MNGDDRRFLKVLILMGAGGSEAPTFVQTTCLFVT
jgi:hypothetical protein